MGILTKGMGVILKEKKINKIRAKAAGVGVLGVGVVAAGVKKIKNIIEKDYGKNK
jgi:hypothetical protein|tara:strand:- start:195 stop:359 length:165 start_codon:yes stop_codon:yes gene_type:complete